MFRIAQAQLGEAPLPDPPIAAPEVNLLSQFCIIDHWSANLANAMMQLGEHARYFHGLDRARKRFGLLEFVRCYEKSRHVQIIALFERSAFENRPFQFSADLRHPGGGRRLVHCFGAHRTIEGLRNGEELYGVFLFSRALFDEV